MSYFTHLINKFKNYWKTTRGKFFTVFGVIFLFIIFSTSGFINIFTVLIVILLFSFLEQAYYDRNNPLVSKWVRWIGWIALVLYILYKLRYIN